MSKATLIIYFVEINDNNFPSFDEIIIDNEHYSTSKGKIEIEMHFNKYEQDLGRKICNYKLLRKKGKNENEDDYEKSSQFTVYLGKNIGYCFIDIIGNTFELLFLRKEGNIKEFLGNSFLIKKEKYSKKEIRVIPNSNETDDRANLLLINCSSDAIISINKEKIINLKKIFSDINVFSNNNSFQICFHNDNYDDFVFREIQAINELNFDYVFNRYHERVNNIYDKLFEKIKEKHSKIEEVFLNLYDEDLKIKLEVQIFKKFNYGKNLLEENLNKECYIDFVFKIIFFMFIDLSISNEKELQVDDINEIHDKLIENKNKICNDKSLKNYEKIILLIELFSMKIILKKNHIINYINLSEIEKNSPMFYAYEFIKDFIKELDNKSKFYYPLLSIDSGRFYYNIKKNKKLEVITTFGFNMLSLDKIKSHLTSMIPNVIILSNYKGNSDMDSDNENDGGTNFMTGNLILNVSKFEKVEIDKKELDEKKSKHYGFIISRILIHELFSHKKSSYSQDEINDYSIISFKDENGNLKFLSDKIEFLYKDKDEIKFGDINKIKKGESGYFLEYYLGKIYDKYTSFILDDIEDETNLAVLLNTKLWHENLSKLIKYVELKYIFFKSYKNIIIDDNLDIDQQINQMQEIIYKNKKENNKNSEPAQQEEELENEIKEKFKLIISQELKKRKSHIDKSKSTLEKTTNEDEHLNLKEYLLRYGFYKK